MVGINPDHDIDRQNLPCRLTTARDNFLLQNTSAEKKHSEIVTVVEIDWPCLAGGKFNEHKKIQLNVDCAIGFYSNLPIKIRLKMLRFVNIVTYFPIIITVNWKLV